MAGSDWLAELTGAVAAALDRPAITLVSVAGGAGNAAFQVFDELTTADPIAFVRAQVGPNQIGGTTHALDREAELMRAAGALGLPVPQVLAVLVDPSALVMKMVPGTSTPSPAQVDEVAAEYMTLIAAVHRADPALFPLDPAATVTEAIVNDLQRFRCWAAAAQVERLPLIRLADRVLELTRPVVDDPPTVLHGDAGAGNFMVHDGRVSAMLDWELSHIGDYHEDLAWMWMRGAHTAFGDPQERLQEYAAASGRVIDPQRLQWHLVLVMWKSLISMYSSLQGSAPSGRTLLHYVVQLTYEALLCSAIGRLVKSPLPLLLETPVHELNPQSKLAEWSLQATPLPREAEIIVTHLRDKAAQATWEANRLAEQALTILDFDHFEVVDAIVAEVDGADIKRLGQINQVLGGRADRSARALPKAVRRIQRAQQIDLCD
ncbi:MAG: hypothetical protein JWM76_4388 [Pseudonocardiales bacterium]|nr:hypothetical protein [Pseudonocardiales bacterium]